MASTSLLVISRCLLGRVHFKQGLHEKLMRPWDLVYTPLLTYARKVIFNSSTLTWVKAHAEPLLLIWFVTINYTSSIGARSNPAKAISNILCANNQLLVFIAHEKEQSCFFIRYMAAIVLFHHSLNIVISSTLVFLDWTSTIKAMFHINTTEFLSLRY